MQKKRNNMSVFEFVRNFHDIKRLEEILVVFLEEGFGFLIQKSKLSNHVPLYKKIKSKFKKTGKENPVRLRKAFERLGPTFIKLGQILSLRPDLIPYDYALEFEKMQDHVPKFSFKEVESILRVELGKPLNKVFKKIESTPVASASVSQVHKAVLKNGKTVAVKVKRPGVENLMKTDIRIMKQITTLLDRHVVELKKYKLPKIVEEFEKWTKKELDFNIEAANAKIFMKNFRKSRFIKFPQVYSSTKNVIIMEYLEGIPLHDQSRIKKYHKNIHTIISRGYGAIVKQVFEDGFYHADPHPGNLLVQKNGKLAFLDFGIVGRFSESLKRVSAGIFMGILNDDPDAVVRSFLKFGVSKSFDEFEFKQDLKELFDPLLYSCVKDVEVSLVLEHAINLASKYGIHVPRDYVLFGKTIVALEGLGLKYDPEFRFIQMTKPLLEKIVLKRYSSKNIKKHLKKNFADYSNLLEEFPGKASTFLDTISKGSIAVDIEDKDVRNFAVEMEKSAGNIALGFIVAALIVGSALIWQIDPQPFTYNNLPFIPFLGLIVAALLGLWVVHRTVFIKFKR